MNNDQRELLAELDSNPTEPLARGEIILMGSCLALGTALLVALVLALLTGGALWVQLERLMEQVEQGRFRAVDFDNFDEFF